MDEENNKQLSELIIRLAQGDVSALKEIAQSVERILMSVGSFYYKNWADVEDAIHNLYVKLYFNASYFKKNTNALAWIVKIFENSIKSHLRRIKSEKKYFEGEISHLKSGTNIVDDRYIENHLFLREIFDKLTKEERRLIIYYYWCRCTLREIAELLRKPKSTIYNKLQALERKIKNF